MKYEVSLQKNKESEPFEKNRDNVAWFYVNDIAGNKITRTCKIELCMSKSAMLGLGKALIRDAFQGDGGGVFQYFPSRPDSGILVDLGIFLHPNSVKVVIIDDIDKSIDDSLK